MYKTSLICLAIFLSGCGGGSGSGSTAPLYSLGGTINGLEASGLQLSNGADVVAPTAGATQFTFSQRVAAGTPYSVSVQKQPLGFLHCGLAGATQATMGNADVSNIQLSCGAVVGVVTTIAGSDLFVLPSSQVPLQDPYGLAVDSSGTIYVADQGYEVIRKISNGVVTTLAGSLGNYGNRDGVGTQAQFNAPLGITIDTVGNVYVTDGANRTVRKITSNGTVSTVAGSGQYGNANGPALFASFTSPSGIAIDSHGNLFVADSYDNRIREISVTGNVTTFAGTGNMGTSDGQGTSASFSHPFGLAIDASDNLYVTDSDSNRIRKITPSGMVSTIAGNNNVPGSFPGYQDGPVWLAQFSRPTGVAVDAAGFIYIADMDNVRVRKLSPSGQVTTLAGDGTRRHVDGIGSAASLGALKSIAADKNGNLFVSEGSWIRKISPPAANN